MTRGIVTDYAGVRFRSRLEARWAVFFDSLDWKWEYEPIDLAGYIPDFVLPFDHAPLLVEVKSELTLAALDPHARRIESSEWEGDALIVGARLFDSGCSYGYKSVGLLSQRFDDEDGHHWCWDEGELIGCKACEQPSVYHPIQVWYCYRCGAHGKVYSGTEAYAPNFEHVWREAGTRVQWRRP